MKKTILKISGFLHGEGCEVNFLYVGKESELRKDVEKRFTDSVNEVYRPKGYENVSIKQKIEMFNKDYKVDDNIRVKMFNTMVRNFQHSRCWELVFPCTHELLYESRKIDIATVQMLNLIDRK